MRRTTIALLCVLTMSTTVSRERDFIHFFRQFFRHFIGATTGDGLKPPSGTPCTTTTGC